MANAHRDKYAVSSQEIKIYVDGQIDNIFIWSETEKANRILASGVTGTLHIANGIITKKVTWKCKGDFEMYNKPTLSDYIDTKWLKELMFGSDYPWSEPHRDSEARTSKLILNKHFPPVDNALP